MEKKDMIKKIQDLKSLQELIVEAEEEVEAIKDQLKAEMGEAEEMEAGIYRLTYKAVKSPRFDLRGLKATLPDIARQYTIETEYKRFTIN